MTPESLALVFLLTYLAVIVIVDWLLAVPAPRRVVAVVVVLILSFFWVYGWPVIMARR